MGLQRAAVTVTLNLTPELEAGLIARANANGMDLERYLLSLAEEAALSSAGQKPIETKQQARREAIRRMMEFGEKHHLSLGEPITRAFLHESHRY
jgi:hypothetical protein